ncbi:MAG: sugar phosphate isomerase/epimerase [Planctomycetota bacterium]|nr:sugar phosphate isomerase/epimerase [Planctomycetota bacterium]
MIRSPLGLRINPDPSRSPKDQIREAVRVGARGVVLDASGDLGPDRLSETGRRDLRQTLRSIELSLIALNLPTRRPFDSEDDLDTRLARADRAFAMAYELGSRLVLVRAGAVPAEEAAVRHAAFFDALSELGKRADHRGVRLAIETGTEPGPVLAAVLNTIASPGLAASLDPATLLRMGHDPVMAARELAGWVAHAYASEAGGGSSRLVSNPRGFGFPGGVLDWEEYLGALEEIDYRGFLTIWPDPSGDQAAQFAAIKARLDRY